MATTTVTEAHDKAVQALVALVPTTRPLTATPSGGAPVGPQAATAVVASYTADVSADMALALIDQDSLTSATEDSSVEVGDILRPALEAAGAALGTAGSLGSVTIADATSLFEDEDASVFELRTPDGPTAGWFAIRTRKKATAGGVGAVEMEKLARIAGVDMTLAVEIGRTKMPVRDVLDLEPGAIVELDRSAGAPADVLLNGRVVAKGEVVVVDGGDYGVRITKILGPDD